MRCLILEVIGIFLSYKSKKKEIVAFLEELQISAELIVCFTNG